MKDVAGADGAGWDTWPDMVVERLRALPEVF